MAETQTAPPPGPVTDAKPIPEVNPGKPVYPDAYAELEELETTAKESASGKREPAREAKPAPSVTGPAKKDAPATDRPDQPTAEAKPAEVPKDDKAEPAEPKPGEKDDSSQFKTAHDLRKDWHRKRELNQKLTAEVETLRKQVTERPSESPDTKVFLEENKALKKRLDEVEGELRYVDYTKSREFKDKFEKPFQDALVDVYEEVKEFYVTNAEGNMRPATSDDFNRVLDADPTEVKALARNLFGEDAADVLQMRRRLVDLRRSASREGKRYREEAGERERQRATKTAEEKASMERMWHEAVDSIPKKYPEYFAPIEGDDEYNRELKAGYEIVDKAHSSDLPLPEKVARLAALRHRAAAFRAQVLKVKRLNARVAELEGVVQEYEKSAPGNGKSDGVGNRGGASGHDGMPAGYRTAAEEIADLAKDDPDEE